jgi:hypothetical protein
MSRGLSEKVPSPFGRQALTVLPLVRRPRTTATLAGRVL